MCVRICYVESFYVVKLDRILLSSPGISRNLILLWRCLARLHGVSKHGRTADIRLVDLIGGRGDQDCTVDAGFSIVTRGMDFASHVVR
jgi:hypothetical protein